MYKRRYRVQLLSNDQVSSDHYFLVKHVVGLRKNEGGASPDR